MDFVGPHCSWRMLLKYYVSQSHPDRRPGALSEILGRAGTIQERRIRRQPYAADGARSLNMPGVSNIASIVEVLRAFLKLGLRSFGGPIAHIGYFRQEFVVRRRWLEDSAFSDLVALCQFLPGPASSQVGFSIGLMRAGYWGGLAAWIGFTLPSAAALVLFAGGVSALRGPTATGLSHGLALVAVAIVAQAVWGMARTLCPDARRASIACAAFVIVLLGASSMSQIAAILFGRHGRAVAVPERRIGAGRSVCRTRFAPRRPGVARDFQRLDRGGDPASGRALTARCGAVQRVLSFRRSGVRRRSCGAAVAARCVRDAGLDQRCRLSRRLRRRAGRCPARCFRSPPIWAPRSRSVSRAGGRGARARSAYFCRAC